MRTEHCLWTILMQLSTQYYCQCPSEMGPPLVLIGPPWCFDEVPFPPVSNEVPSLIQ